MEVVLTQDHKTKCLVIAAALAPRQRIALVRLCLPCSFSACALHLIGCTKQSLLSPGNFLALGAAWRLQSHAFEKAQHSEPAVLCSELSIVVDRMAEPLGGLHSPSNSTCHAT